MFLRGDRLWKSRRTVGRRSGCARVCADRRTVVVARVFRSLGFRRRNVRVAHGNGGNAPRETGGRTRVHGGIPDRAGFVAQQCVADPDGRSPRTAADRVCGLGATQQSTTGRRSVGKPTDSYRAGGRGGEGQRDASENRRFGRGPSEYAYSTAAGASGKGERGHALNNRVLRYIYIHTRARAQKYIEADFGEGRDLPPPNVGFTIKFYRKFSREKQHHTTPPSRARYCVQCIPCIVSGSGFRFGRSRFKWENS